MKRHRVALADGTVIEVVGMEAVTPNQTFFRISRNLVAGTETEKVDQDNGRVRFFRNLGAYYEFVGFIFIKEEGNSCVLFDICVSQPESSQEFIKNALAVQKQETDFLLRKRKFGDLHNSIKILARPHCA